MRLSIALAGVGAASAGETVHQLKSVHQADETIVRVFTPSTADAAPPWRTLYVLPVEAGTGTRWGDPADEVRRLELADRHGLVIVLPTFSALPWYADHPTDPSLRQERYLLEDVLPLVESKYPVEVGPEGRLLVGFSKSGWGAWSLLLRHPKVFFKAAAWDAPLMQATPDKFGMGPIFGTEENFERYRIARLIQENAATLRDRPRLVLTGYSQSFREHHVEVHEMLDDLGIPHAYRDGPRRTHDWHSGWLEEAVRILGAP